MLKQTLSSLLAMSSAIFIQAANAEPAGKHLYEAAKADPTLAAEFDRAMKPFFSSSAWVESFGTTAPPTTEKVNGQSYDVYWGCKPHDCVSESYVVMYNPEAKQITAGAFLRTEFDGPNLTASNITWVEKTDFDAARVLGKYLY